MNKKRCFEYHGPVIRFGNLVTPNYIARAMAVSKEKALNDLKYRYKKSAGLLPSSSIDMPGDLIEISDVFEEGDDYGAVS